MASATLAELKMAVSKKLDTLEGQARRKLVLNGKVDDTLSRLGLIRTRMHHANDMETVWEMVSTISMLEKEMDGGRAKISGVALSAPSGRRSPFFDYLLSEHLPAHFVQTAMLFGDEVRQWGWTLAVDNGVVFAELGKREDLVGQLAIVIRPQAVLSSERGWKRRGEWSRLPFCCSVKLSSEQLGVSVTEMMPFIMRRIDQSQPWNRMLLYQMDSRFARAGFAYELNEDGTRVHLYYYAAEGQRVVATIFGGRVEVPPEAWIEKR